MMLIDTGFLIALVDSGDELRTRAESWLDFLEPPLLITEYIWLETLNYFAGTPLRGQSLQFLDQLSDSRSFIFVDVNDALRREGLELYRRRPDKHWSMTDCVSFGVMRNRGIDRALAYDQHFEQAGFDALLRRDPS